MKLHAINVRAHCSEKSLCFSLVLERVQDHRLNLWHFPIELERFKWSDPLPGIVDKGLIQFKETSSTLYSICADLASWSTYLLFCLVLQVGLLRLQNRIIVYEMERSHAVYIWMVMHVMWLYSGGYDLISKPPRHSSFLIYFGNKVWMNKFINCCCSGVFFPQTYFVRLENLHILETWW